MNGGRGTVNGAKQTMLTVLDAMHRERGRAEYSLEEVVERIAERTGVGPEPSRRRVAAALAAAVQSGYATRTQDHHYALSSPVGNFMTLLKTSFGRPRTTKRAPREKRKVRGKVRRAGRRRGARCEGCGRVRRCQCGVGCGCRVTCQVCSVDTVERAKTAEARQKRLERRQLKLKRAQRKSHAEETARQQPEPRRVPTPRSRQPGQSANVPDDHHHYLHSDF